MLAEDQAPDSLCLLSTSNKMRGGSGYSQVDHHHLTSGTGAVCGDSGIRVGQIPSSLL